MKIKIALIVFITVTTTSCSYGEIDACLDDGGSFNYEKCECDFNGSHDYKDDHSC